MSLENGLRFISTTIGEVGAVGMACLLALHVADRNMAEDELMAVVHIESLSTLRRHLNFCAMHDYASMVRKSIRSSSLWHITDLGKSIILKVISLFGLPGASPTADPELIALSWPSATEKKFFSAPSSSSSSDPDSIKSDSDLIETEEEEEGREFKKFLCREFGLTGERARQIIDDKRIWSEDLVAWMFHVHQLQRAGTKFRKSPEAYAIGCLLKPDGPDDPPAEALHNAQPALDMYWRQFQARKKDLQDDDETDA